MFKNSKSKQAVKDQQLIEAEGMIAAFNRSQAVIEFDLFVRPTKYQSLTTRNSGPP